MRPLFDNQNRLTKRCFRHALVIAVLVLLTPMLAWAHFCGAKKVTVKKGDSVEHAITGDHPARYEVTDTGNPLVATIEPLNIKSKVNGIFNVTGVGDGTTAFKIDWEGPRRKATCQLKVTVTAE